MRRAFSTEAGSFSSQGTSGSSYLVLKVNLPIYSYYSNFRPVRTRGIFDTATGGFLY